FAGPGDRVATELAHGGSSIAPTRLQLAPHHSELVYSLPVPPNTQGDPVLNGRSTWLALNAGAAVHLSELALFVPMRDGAFRPPTRQSQTAPMVVRYAEAAREAQGNYAVFYDMALPLANPDATARRYTLALTNPSRSDGRKLTYMQPPGSAVFFRGTVRVEVD